VVVLSGSHHETARAAGRSPARDGVRSRRVPGPRSERS
jgi:hypothetical protein